MDARDLPELPWDCPVCGYPNRMARAEDGVSVRWNCAHYGLIDKSGRAVPRISSDPNCRDCRGAGTIELCLEDSGPQSIRCACTRREFTPAIDEP